MDLVLFGIQGSGKGTQAKRLAAEFGYYIFGTGDELRKIASQDSELGTRVKSIIDAGNLVPHEIVMSVVREAIKNVPTDTPILFDGIPRDTDQMNDFNAIMQELDRPFRCIEILLPIDEAKSRILGRAKIENRTDDADMASIEKRMNIFKDKTQPVIDAYDQKKMMIKIDGHKTMDEVYEDLKQTIQR